MFSGLGKKSHIDTKKSLHKAADAKKDAVTRLKHLKSVFDNQNNKGVKEIIDKNYSLYFSTSYEAYVLLDPVISIKGGLKVNRDDIDVLITVIEKIFIHIPSVIYSGWHCHTICHMLKRFLHPENSAKLRRYGLRLFSIWLQSIRERAPPEMFYIYAALLPLENSLCPLSELLNRESRSGAIALQSIRSYHPVFESDPEGDGSNESAILLRHMLYSMVKNICLIIWQSDEEQVESFTYMLGIFRQSYIQHIFPDFCWKTNLYVDNKVLIQPIFYQEGFAACSELKITVIKWLIQILTPTPNQHSSTTRQPEFESSRKIAQRILFSTRNNINFCMEILRQAFFLPLSDSGLKTIKSVLRLFMLWISCKREDHLPIFFKPQKVALMRLSSNEFEAAIKTTSSDAVTDSNESTLGYDERLHAGPQNSIQFIFNLISYCFLIRYPTTLAGQFAEALYELQIRRALNIFRSAAKIDGCNGMDSETWLYSIRVQLHISSNFVSPLSEKFASNIYNTLLVNVLMAHLYVSLPIGIWDQLQDTLSKHCISKVLIDEWGKVMLLLTKILGKFVYCVDLDAEKSPMPPSVKHEKSDSTQNPVAAKVRESFSIFLTKTKSDTARTRSLTDAFSYSFISDVSRIESPEDDVFQSTAVRSRYHKQAKPFKSETHLHTTSDSDFAFEGTHSKTFDAESLTRNLHFSETSQDDGESYSSSIRNDGQMNDSSFTEESFVSSPFDQIASSDCDQLYLESATPVSGEQAHQSVNQTCNDEHLQEGQTSRLNLTTPESSCDSDESTAIEKVPAHNRSILCGGKLLGWHRENAAILWRRMLGCLGDVNNIRDEHVHAYAFSYIIKIWEALYPIFQSVDFDREEMHFEDELLIPPITIFLPWIFNACKFAPGSYIEGRIYSHSLLCRTFLSTPNLCHGDEVMANFYLALHYTLTGDEIAMKHEIIRWCSAYFSIAISGHLLLLQDLIEVAYSIVFDFSTDETAPHYEAVVLLGSLICFPKHFDSVVCLDPQSRESKLCSLSASNLTGFVFSAVLEAAKTSPHVKSRLAALKCLYIYIVSEIKGVYDSSINCAIEVILSSLCRSSLDLANLSCFLLYHLANYHTYLTDFLKRSIINGISHSLCQFHKQVMTNKSEEDISHSQMQFIVNSAFCLCSWSSRVSLSFLTSKVNGFSVIESIVKSLKPFSNESSSYESTSPLSCSDYSHLSNSLPHGFDSCEEGSSSARDERVASFYTIDGNNQISFNFRSTANLAAQHALRQIFQISGQFPVGQCVSYLGSLVAENHSNPSATNEEFNAQLFNTSNFQIFVHQSSIISMIETHEENEENRSNVRIIVRDITGRYVWDFKPMLQSTPDTSVKNSARFPNSLYTPSSFSSQSTPNLQSAEPTQYSEFISKLIESTQDVSLSYDSNLKKENHLLKQDIDNASELVEIEQLRRNQQLFENDIPYSTSALASPPIMKNQDKDNPFKNAAQLMDHLNFFSWNRRWKLNLVEKSSRLVRDLKHFDKLPTRDCYKIAVVYVGPGQENKEAILSNERGSTDFENFLGNLGWEVKLSEHVGFRGGLQTNGSCGETALYFASPTQEVIFHVNTLLPTNQSDPSQTEKMRHIGNDYVHIVWSEHWKAYDSSCLRTEFADVIIAVYPLTNGLFKIDILCKSEITPDMIGPLFPSMIVDGIVLGDLVRSTAVRADWLKRSRLQFHRQFFEERAQYLSNLIKTHTLNYSFEKFVQKSVIPNKESMSSSRIPTNRYTITVGSAVDSNSALKKRRYKSGDNLSSQPLISE